MAIIIKYDKVPQYLRVVVPLTEEDANLMEELGISLNLNLAACWLKLSAFEAAKHHCDLILKLDFGNVKARSRRAQAVLQLSIVEAAHNDFILALMFDPKNDEVKKELTQVEGKCNST